jgi:hypothetical protein
MTRVFASFNLVGAYGRSPGGSKKINIVGVALLMVAFLCVAGQSVSGKSLQQADLDQYLNGEWTLDAVEFKLGNNTQRLSIESLMSNPTIKSLVGSFVDDRYFSVLFRRGEVGLDLRNPTNNFNRPLKGTYSIANDKLTISMQGEQSHTFNYRIENEQLYISYVQGSNQLSLIFKLYIKY